jgi:hypothetical protein
MSSPPLASVGCVDSVSVSSFAAVGCGVLGICVGSSDACVGVSGWPEHAVKRIIDRLKKAADFHMIPSEQRIYLIAYTIYFICQNTR